MKRFLKPAAFFVAAIIGCVTGNAKDYVITQHGVLNDSTVVQTSKIQSVIDLAESEGGGTIVVPKGTYLTGGLFFRVEAFTTMPHLSTHTMLTDSR